MKKFRKMLVYLMVFSILLPNFSVLVKEGHAVATTTSETEEEEDLSYYFYNLKDVLSYLFYQDKI